MEVIGKIYGSHRNDIWKILDKYMEKHMGKYK
jgi:hypothetical protein